MCLKSIYLAEVSLGETDHVALHIEKHTTQYFLEVRSISRFCESFVKKILI